MELARVGARASDLLIIVLLPCVMVFAVRMKVASSACTVLMLARYKMREHATATESLPHGTKVGSSGAGVPLAACFPSRVELGQACNAVSRRESSVKALKR